MQETASTTPKELEVKLEVDPKSLPALNKIPLFRTLKAVPTRPAEAKVAQEGLDVARPTKGWSLYPND